MKAFKGNEGVSGTITVKGGTYVYVPIAGSDSSGEACTASVWDGARGRNGIALIDGWHFTWDEGAVADTVDEP